MLVVCNPHKGGDLLHQHANNAPTQYIKYKSLFTDIKTFIKVNKEIAKRGKQEIRKKVCKFVPV